VLLSGAVVRPLDFTVRRQPVRSQWLADALRGKVSLSRAFWFYGLGISVGYSLIGLLIDIQNVRAVTVYLLVGAALGVLQTIVLWRCAYNSRSRFLGGLVRTAIVFGLIVVAVMLYVLFTNWDLLLPPNNRWSGP
jgi:FtsH-binding integral membrane protein